VSNLDEYLRRAVDANRLVKLSRGLYAPVRSVRSVSFPEDDAFETHKLTELTHSHGGE
jgi:hypothetical protein